MLKTSIFSNSIFSEMGKGIGMVLSCHCHLTHYVPYVLDIINTNHMFEDLRDLKEKLFTRDIFGRYS